METTLIQQPRVDYIADNLDVRFEVLSNLVGGTSYFTARITLTNGGMQPIPDVGGFREITTLFSLFFDRISGAP